MAIDQAAPLGEPPCAGAFYNRSMMGSGNREGGPGPIRGSSMSESSNSGYSSLSGGYDYPNPVSFLLGKSQPSVFSIMLFVDSCYGK